MSTNVNPDQWLQEGDGLLTSARLMRANWLWRRRAFSALIKSGRPKKSAWSELTGLPRSSCLLLGYAVEMYLKMGISKLYLGCRDEMFVRDIKRIYNHNLLRIAEDIGLPLNRTKRAALNQLRDFVLVDARYPIIEVGRLDATKAYNIRIQKIWNSKTFRQYCRLANEVRAFVAKLDQDSGNPATPRRIEVDKDGYIALRKGGGLPSRITYRPSTDQKAHGEIHADDARLIVEQYFGPHPWSVWWRQCWIVHDGDQFTTVQYQPINR